MSSSVPQPSFAPRPNLRRTLTFRPIVRTCYYWYSIYLSFHAIYLVWDLSSKLQQGVPFSIAFQKAAWAFLSFGFLLSFFILRQLTHSKIHVHSKGISLQVKDKTTEVPFEEMQELRLPKRMFGFRGFFAVKMKSGTTYYFTVALERSEYVLESIASARPDIVDLERLAAFRIDAIATDHLLARLKMNLEGSGRKSLVRYFLSPLVQAMIVAFLFEQTGRISQTMSSLWMYFALINAGIGIFSDFIVNFFMKSKTKTALQQNPKAVIRDMVYEKKVYRVSGYLHWGLSLAFLAYFLLRGYFEMMSIK